MESETRYRGFRINHDTPVNCIEYRQRLMQIDGNQTWQRIISWQPLDTILLRRSVTCLVRSSVSYTIYNSKFHFINCTDNALMLCPRTTVIFGQESPLTIGHLSGNAWYTFRGCCFGSKVDVMGNNKREIATRFYVFYFGPRRKTVGFI